MDKWIIHSKQTKSLNYTYFYLKWTHTTQPTIHASWYKELPKGCTFQKEVYWRDFKKKIIICGELSFSNNIDLSHVDKPNKIFRSMPLLKSLLQKSIRRNNIRSAILSAYECMNLDMQQFLRRLTVIMLEDAFIHPSIQNVIWFMSAYPHIVLDSTHKSYILGIVHNMCRSKIKHHITKKEECDTISDYTSDPISIFHKDLALSLYLRKSYGGMKGDMKMINGFIDSELRSIPNDYIFTPIKNIQIRDTLQQSDVLLCSADFHCFPSILHDIEKKHTNYSLDDIKHAIWTYSSSISYKQKYTFVKRTTTSKIDNRDDSVWKHIRNTFYVYTKKYIYRSMYLKK